MRVRTLAIVTGVFLVAGTAAGFAFSDQPVAQAYPFDHAAHTARAGCVTCHLGVRTGARAGIPDLAFCAGCHATAPGREPRAEQQALWQAARAGDAPPFERLHRLPGHVYFSHRRHVLLAAIACERCHGDIGARSTPPDFPLVQLGMGDCIDCHESERVTTDCTACHR